MKWEGAGLEEHSGPPEDGFVARRIWSGASLQAQRGRVEAVRGDGALRMGPVTIRTSEGSPTPAQRLAARGDRGLEGSGRRRAEEVVWLVRRQEAHLHTLPASM